MIAAGRVAFHNTAEGTDTGRRHVIYWPLLRDRNMLLISASYFLDSYVLAMFVFWFYLYLIDERGFSILESGAFSSLPWITALILVPAAGRVCDLLSARHGRRRGRRVVAMTALSISSVLLLWGARAEQPMLAIAFLLSPHCVIRLRSERCVSEQRQASACLPDRASAPATHQDYRRFRAHPAGRCRTNSRRSAGRSH
jgi:sugar phosphate permease